MKNILLFLFLFLSIYSVFSQNITINGFVQDVNSGEKLPFASIFVNNIEKVVVTNQYGFYSLTLQAGNINISVSYLGCKTLSNQYFLTKDTIINIFQHHLNTSI